MRPSFAFLSAENLKHNINTIKKLVGPTKIIAMVKANAYGHGIRSTAQTLEGYADVFGVASLDEALAIRKIGIKTPILLMEGVFDYNELAIAAEEGIHVALHNLVQLNWLEQFSKPLYVWLKVSTGMGRLGFSINLANKVYQRLLELNFVQKPIKIFSHFSCADEKENPINNQQINTFKNFIANKKGEYSFCNSAALFNFQNCHYDYVRPGLALYGISPFPNKTAESLNLKPVMTVCSELIAVHQMEKGQSVGYGACYVCETDMPVGIIAFGYGDGYPITTKKNTPILVNNVRCPILGSISMDMMAVDLRPYPNAQIGSKVVLWGKDLEATEIAACTNQIPWSLICGIQNRVRCIWEQ